MATKKDYEAIAKILRKHAQVEDCDMTFLMHDLCEYFKLDNPQFDNEKFYYAVLFTQ